MKPTHFARFYIQRSRIPLTCSAAQRRLREPRRPYCSHKQEVRSEPSSDFIYHPIEEVERFEYYIPGGYHPIHLGDRLHDRYEVIHKLGFGPSSTVWLARDEKTVTYVAIKISTASTLSESESNVLNFLIRKTDYHPGEVHVRFSLDSFKIQGPNGSHQCLAMELARMNLEEAREALGIFHPTVARAVAAQLVMAVASLHSRGVVHGGEYLHEGNILLRFPKKLTLHHLEPAQLYEQFREPVLDRAKRYDGKHLGKGVPRYGIAPVFLGKGASNLTHSESHMYLADFDESFQPAIVPRYYSQAPHVCRSPESFFEPFVSASFSSDIWALACCIFLVHGEEHLFRSFFYDENETIHEQTEALGRLPLEWWTAWTSRNNGYHESEFDEEPMTLEDRFESFVQAPRRERSLSEVGMEEKAALLNMLRSMLAFKPEDRASIEQVLQSEWMSRWALPELDRVGSASHRNQRWHALSSLCFAQELLLTFRPLWI